MGDILFLAHRIPFPPDRGDKIRSHHVLRHLADLGPVHVGCFTESADDARHVERLAKLAQTHCAVRRRKSMVQAGAEALLSGQPVSLTAFRARAITDYVARTLAEHPVEAIYVFSGQMAQYVAPGYAGRVVMDFVDMDSAKFKGYANIAAQPMRAIYAREARRLLAFEQGVARRADVSLFVSSDEAADFSARAGICADRIRVMGNGVDTACFDPATVAPEPRMAPADRWIVFTGQMDYPPNVEAVTRFAREALPQVRDAVPRARFAIVGRNPAREVLALDGHDGVLVSGEVADVRGWLKAADVVVAPLAIARGVQNKMLEAMAMACPMVVSREAAKGIGATDSRDFLVAGGDTDQSRLTVALLNDRIRAEAMGAAARVYVERNHGWPAMLAPLEAMLCGPCRQRDVA